MAKANGKAEAGLRPVWTRIGNGRAAENRKAVELAKRIPHNGLAGIDDAALGMMTRRLYHSIHDPLLRGIPKSQARALLEGLARAPKAGRQKTDPAIVWMNGYVAEREEEAVKSDVLFADLIHRALRRQLRLELGNMKSGHHVFAPAHARAAALRKLRPKRTAVAEEALVRWFESQAKANREPKLTKQDRQWLQETSRRLCAQHAFEGSTAPGPQAIRRALGLQSDRTRRREKPLL